MTPEERRENPQYWHYRYASYSGVRARLARLTRRQRSAHLAIMRITKGRAA